MRADLRLADLGTERSPSKLMNVKVPADLNDAIDQAAADLGCSKTAVVIALVNEGLDAFAARRAEFPAARGPRRVRRGRPAVAVEESQP